MLSFDDPIVAVDGATGYVGSHLVHSLCKKGVGVRAVVRPGAHSIDCDFLVNCGAEVFVTHLDSNAMKDALDGASCVVHLIGSIAPSKGQGLEHLHVGLTEQLLDAAQHSAAKVLMVTALGAAEHADNEYHRTKWQAEEILRKSGRSYVIIRPSLIVGRQAGSRDSKLVARYIHLINTRKRVPLVGGGKNLLQPVFIGDLVSALSRAALDPTIENTALEIGGPEVLSMKDLILKLMEAMGKQKPVQAVPFWLASLVAPFLETVQAVPLLSRDQVKLSAKDNICRDNVLPRLLDHAPATLDEALASYKILPSESGTGAVPQDSDIRPARAS